MMLLSCSTSHSSTRLALYSPSVHTSSALCSYSSISFCQMISHTILREESFRFSVDRCNKYTNLCAIDPRKTSSSTTHVANWEDPDGSDSEDEEELESEENDRDFESDWEEETDDSETSNNMQNLSTSSIEEHLIKVEQLLSPEELEILQQNEAPDLNKISTEKWNPLHTLGLAGQIKFMDSLLANGFDIDAVDKDGQTALHKAVLGKKEAVISHLLRKGASPNVQDMDGATPLHYAIQVSAMQSVKLLIKSKADVNVADNEGWTPLHVAMQTRNRDISKVLLLNGADKTRRTQDGKTALDVALCYGKDFKAYDLAKLLKLVPANTY
ncbi:ankyrin repeat domain-containing protein EMB506, chloroplastic isoform X2 [Rutidosis leptorrhynchoides]|uniref:ankyrin repeat domain-containing protein EMB506, chloroplastic isoform X2 n=1 Tax=Rutidosis leptorrhynchoides TaxID=125765 RepID=UPI003A9A4367